MAKNVKIKITKDGPYIVTGSIPLLGMKKEIIAMVTSTYGARLRDILCENDMPSVAMENPKICRIAMVLIRSNYSTALKQPVMNATSIT